ncbi:hypothetical protein PPROV_000994400 [Pycnococcus provasolii]|uniref:Uncharacterized protein n=1 Tax=Pycnococcus provasolii TaxID=41880 RepID=A0A830HVG7_9CHLO|nr:hypothetical protein PPROV_000994400 [Pycnococcus provasolii]
MTTHYPDRGFSPSFLSPHSSFSFSTMESMSDLFAQMASGGPLPPSMTRPRVSMGPSSILTAARDDNVALIRSLCAPPSSTAVDSCNQIGQSAIHIACIHGRLASVELLLELGSDPSLPNDRGSTPLHFAATAKRNVKEVVALLLSKGADPDTMDMSGRLPFEMCSDNEVREMLGGPSQALLDAAANGNVDALTSILAAGPNTDGADSDGQCALHLAAMNGHLPCVQALVNAAATVDIFNMRGETPLFLAAAEGDADVVKFLLDHGADPSVQRVNEQAEKYSEAMGWISSGGGAPPGASDSAMTDAPMDDAPLHVCAAEGDEDMVELLLERGAFVDARDAEQKTPLHIALDENELGVAKLLLDAGADPCTGNRGTTTVLHWCASRGKVKAMRMLLEAGASKISGPEIGEALIEDGGADPMETPDEPAHIVAARLSARFRNRRWLGSSSWTPLLLACRQGKPEAVQLLVQYAMANPFDRTPASATRVTSAVANAPAANASSGHGSGRTALHIIAGNGTVNCLDPLLDSVRKLAIAHPDHASVLIDALLAKDCDGRTPMDVAVDSGHAELSKIIADKAAEACRV